MIALVFAAVGLVIGSFLNVVILRYGERSVRGRSACMSCRKQLRWYEMVPIFSWLVLAGRCRSCNARISIQYPATEAATAFLFGCIGVAGLSPALTLLALAVVACLICIFVYDLYHTVIPDPWVWSFCILALVFATSYQLPATGYLLAGPVAALPLFSLWAVSRGRWMGFGDVKLSLGIGWLLGFPFGLVAVMFAFVLGAIVSVGILLPLPTLARALGITQLESGDTRFTMKSEVPFGPFLISSCLIVWFALLYGIPIPLISNL